MKKLVLKLKGYEEVIHGVWVKDDFKGETILWKGKRFFFLIDHEVKAIYTNWFTFMLNKKDKKAFDQFLRGEEVK